MITGKFKVGDKVRTLKCETKYGYKRFVVGTVGRIISIITNIDNVPYKYQVEFYGCYYWYEEDELELVELVADVDGDVRKNDICSDVARDVTVEEVEKLEEELRRKDSELRDLKELIIKLLFDRYGY